MSKDTMLNLSMLMLRLILGGIFIVHGAQKLFGMFDGIGVEGTAKMVEGLGFSNAYTLAVAWASTEFVSGILLVLGILSRAAGAVIFFLLAVQLWKANLSFGLFLQSSEIEHNLVVLAACIPLVLLGGGSWSVWDV